MATEKRLIDADAFVKCTAFLCGGNAADPYYNGYADALDRVEEVLRNFPTVEAVEVVHGQWVEVPSMAPEYQCSNCDQTFEWWERSEAHYCPHCGAKMDLKGE